MSLAVPGCSWLGAGFVLAVAVAQDAPRADRQVTFVRVESGGGDPLAGAEVTFVGCHPHLGGTVRAPDVWRVATDARGRAQAKLLPGLCYVMWAVGPVAADGAAAVTPVHGWFGAGALRTLVAEAPVPRRRGQLLGRQAWAALGPLLLYARTAAPAAEAELELDADGRFVVPHGPFDDLELRCADGQPLWCGGFAAQVVLPPPRQVPLQVVDQAGQPIAGAELRQRVGRSLPWRRDSLGGVVDERWRALGTTDPDGKLVVTVPYATDPLQGERRDDLLLFARAPGRPAVSGGVFQRSLYQSDHPVNWLDGDVLRFELRPATPLVGAVAAVPSGSIAHLAAVCKRFVDRTSYLHEARSFEAPIGADGRFQFDDVPAELHASRLTLVGPEGSTFGIASFAAMPGRQLPPAFDGGEPKAWLGDAVVDLRVRLADANGGPARGAVVYVVPTESAQLLVRDSTLRLAADSRGLATARLAPGRWSVVVADGAEWAAQRCELEVGERELVLALQPMATMQVELRSDGDRPLAGACLHSLGTTVRGTTDSLQSLLQGLQERFRAGWSDLRTDAEGRLTIPFVPIEGVLQKLAFRWADGQSQEFVLRANAEPMVVRPK